MSVETATLSEDLRRRLWPRRDWASELVAMLTELRTRGASPARASEALALANAIENITLDRQAAAEAYLLAWKCDRDQIPLLSRARRLCLEQRQYATVAKIAKLQGQRTGDPDFIIIEGMAWLDAGQHNRAVKPLLDANRAQPNRPDLTLALAAAQQEWTNVRALLVELESKAARETNEEVACQLYLLAARIFRMLGTDPSEYRRNLIKAFEANPRSDSAYFLLSDALASERDLKTLLAVYRNRAAHARVDAERTETLRRAGIELIMRGLDPATGARLLTVAVNESREAGHDMVGLLASLALLHDYHRKAQTLDSFTSELAKELAATKNVDTQVWVAAKLLDVGWGVLRSASAGIAAPILERNAPDHPALADFRSSGGEAAVNLAGLSEAMAAMQQNTLGGYSDGGIAMPDDEPPGQLELEPDSPVSAQPRHQVSELDVAGPEASDAAIPLPISRDDELSDAIMAAADEGEDEFEAVVELDDSENFGVPVAEILAEESEAIELPDEDELAAIEQAAIESDEPLVLEREHEIGAVEQAIAAQEDAPIVLPDEEELAVMEQSALEEDAPVLVPPSHEIGSETAAPPPPPPHPIPEPEPEPEPEPAPEPEPEPEPEPKREPAAMKPLSLPSLPKAPKPPAPPTQAKPAAPKPLEKPASKPAKAAAPNVAAPKAPTRPIAPKPLVSPGKAPLKKPAKLAPIGGAQKPMAIPSIIPMGAKSALKKMSPPGDPGPGGELRVSPRTNLSANVRFVVKGGDGKKHRSVTKDVSDSGLFLVTQLAIDIGSFVELELELPKLDDEWDIQLYNAEAKVSRKIGDRGYGVEFHNITDELKSHLRELASKS